MQPDFEWYNWDHPLCANFDGRAEVQKWLQVWQSYISPGAWCVDVGAWIGDTTVPMALLAGATGNVIAFEPSPANETLVKNTAGLKTPVLVVKAAAGTFDGHAEFHYVDEAGFNGGRLLPNREHQVRHTFPRQVRVLPLLPACDERLDFIKLDTEGNDLELLESIHRVLGQCRPTIQTEFYPDENKTERVKHINYLRGFGYILRDCTGRVLSDDEILNSFMIDVIASTKTEVPVC